MPPNADVENRSSSRKSAARVSTKRSSVRKSTSKRASISSSSSSSNKRSSRRASSKRNSRRQKTKSGGTNLLRSAWMVAMPFVVTLWTGTAVMWSLVLTWILIKFRKATRKDVDQVTSSKEFWTFLHECVSFLVIDMNPFWERNVIRDIPKEELPGRSIFMGNHVSFSDGWFTTGLIPIAPKVAAQAPVFDYPFIGEILGESGNIPVEFEQRPNGKWGTAKGAGDRILARAKNYLDHDCPVAVMPEGAISLTGDLLAFKPGFFKLAVETDTPIIPFAIWGNQEAWPMVLGTVGYSVPQKTMRSASVWVHMGAPMYPEGRTVEELSDAVRARIIEMRDALPNYRGNDEHYNPEVIAY